MLAIGAVPGVGSGVVGLFLETDWIARGVVFILMCLSVISWAVILLKYQYLRRADAESRLFLSAFRKTKNPRELLKVAESKKYSPLATLFAEGYREAETIIRSGTESKTVPVKDEDATFLAQEIERAVKITTQDEVAYMERYLVFLGTVGTIGPLCGLFGTIWGVMEAFYGIGLKGGGDISALAPGLAAALVTTASGLFVAIPAVIFYNYFVDKIKDISVKMDSFALEFLSFMDRSLLRR